MGAGTGAVSDLEALLGISDPGSKGTVDWAAYVRGNPDAMADWQKFHKDMSLDQYGQYHYTADGSRRDLTPYTTGVRAPTDGSAGQADAIAALQASPLYQSLYRNGEEAVLQNSSATGGLRGGNIQRSLANFGADTLSQTIQQQLANLSGVAGLGANAAGAQAGAAGNMSSALAQIMSQIGDTNAGGILGRSTIDSNTINGVAKGLGSIADGGGVGKIISGIGKLF